MKLLVIGSGAREHALVWKLHQSPRVSKIFAAPGNAGIAEIAECVPIGANELHALREFARSNAIDLTVVGPEVPLVAGIVDEFLDAGLKILGPRKFAAQLEGSKEFAKRFMRRYNIPTASFRSFVRAQHHEALAYVAAHPMPVVIKADGLAAGKGVVVAQSAEEATRTIDAMFMENIFGDAGATIVVEDFLEGEEASVFALCDGDRFVTFAPAQDHKRIGDGDTGKNTGGMGAFAPASIVTNEILERVKREVVEPVMRGMREEGCPYTGFLFVGLMIGRDGPKVVEFNCRMGDPETEVVLPLIDGDFAELCLACAEGNVNSSTIGQVSGAAVCVVMASRGYPDSYPLGMEISGLDSISADDTVIAFHAGTKRVTNTIVTAGGRVLAITAIGKNQTVKETIAQAYAAVGKISFDGAYCRKDIGSKNREA